MIDQDDADQALQRIALTSLLYYPAISTDDASYQFDDEVTWCLESLGADDREKVRELVADTILDPTEHRAELFSRFMELTADKL
jgi:hypothetical protein